MKRMIDPALELARKKGFYNPHAVRFMPYSVTADGKLAVDYDRAVQLAKDSALVTTGSVGAPENLLTVQDPTVTEILFSATNAAKLANEGKKGDWADRYMNFNVVEYTGETTPYSDYAENVSSDVNIESPARENYLFQTVISYGDLEMATVSRQKLALVAEKQKAAATILSKAHNKFYLFGVAGKKLYGLLNDPNLPATISPASVSIGGSNYSTWADKTEHANGDAANLIYNDVLKLFNALSADNGGHVDTSSPIVLAVSNARAAYLNAPNTYGLTAAKMLMDNFPNLSIVQLPELSTASGEWAYMLVPELFASPTVELAFSEKMRMGRLVAEMSSYKQKAIGGTWGAIIRRPSLIRIMTGI